MRRSVVATAFGDDAERAVLRFLSESGLLSPLERLVGWLSRRWSS